MSSAVLSRTALGVVAIGVGGFHASRTSAELDGTPAWLVGADVVSAALLVVAAIAAAITRSYLRSVLVSSIVVLQALTISYRDGAPWQVPAQVAGLVLPVALIWLGSSPGLRTPRRQIVVVAGASVVLGVVQLVVYDPFFDIRCGRVCAHSPLSLVADIGLANGMASVRSVILASGFVLAAWVFSSRAGPMTAVRLTGAAACVLLAGEYLSHLGSAAARSWVEPDAHTVILHTLGAAALGVSAIGAELPAVLTIHHLRRALAAIERGQDSVSLEDSLRVALASPTLRVGYRVEGADLLDQSGKVMPTPTKGSFTELRWKGRQVALVIHESGELGIDQLAARIGPRSLVSIQNESLRLGLRRQVQRLDESRRRLVQAGDDARRSIERDLHDGAQHRLLALSYELARARRSVAGGQDLTLRRDIDNAVSAVQRVLPELRELSSGIHPATLQTIGLGPALVRRGESLGLQVRIRGDELLAGDQSDLYAIVDDLLTHAAESTVTVWISEDGPVLSCCVDGVTATEYAEDRAAVAGGTLCRHEDGVEVRFACE